MTNFVRSLLALFLVAASLPIRPVPAMAQSDSPATFSGVLHYSERGPGAFPGGIADAFLLGIAAPVYIIRLQGIVDLLERVPGVADQPTMQSVSEYLNNGVPVDLGQEFPIRAGYTATMAFDLEMADEGVFHLLRGHLVWEGSNNTRLDIEGGGIADSFHGSGSYALDPARDQVTFGTDSGQGSRTFSLEVSVIHPLAPTGRSDWTGGDGAFAISVEANDGTITLDGQSLGLPLSTVGPFPMVLTEMVGERSVGYVRQGSLSEMSGSETWRTLTDSQVVVEYHLYAECSATITEPEADRLIMDRDQPEGVEFTARATVTPPDWEVDLEWEWPEVQGSEVLTKPEDGRGNEVVAWFDGMPADNPEFGDREIGASFVELADRCRPVAPRPVRFFFNSTAQGNPQGNVPNWFYYWSQTSAAQGHGDSIRYDGACSDYGYYSGLHEPELRDVIYVCDLNGSGFYSENPISGQSAEGIDVFATTVLHEWTHLENIHDWWGSGGSGGYDASRDADADSVPDDREAEYGLVAGVQDSWGYGFLDREYTAYTAESGWPVGSADSEDWACPGKQCSEGDE